MPSAKKKEKKISSIPRMSAKDKGKFVDDYCSNRVFTSVQLSLHDTSRMLHLVFMPLGLGGACQFTKKALLDVGIIWEYMSEAMPRMINNFPMFPSLRFMHKDDWDDVRKQIMIELDRRKSVRAGSAFTTS